METMNNYGIHMNTFSLGCTETVCKWILNVFFFSLPFCLVWNLAIQCCSLPPSLPRPAAQSLHDVYDCVTQSGSPGVRVSVAQCVSYCEEDTLWMQAKIKEIITDLGAAQQCG